MYEKDAQRIQLARVAASSDGAVRAWTASNVEELAVQAIALMDFSGVALPKGTIDDLVALVVPRRSPFATETEFRPWSQQEVVAFGYHSVGEIVLGDSVNAFTLSRTLPTVTDNNYAASS
jgi:hypothetical protein